MHRYLVIAFLAACGPNQAAPDANPDASMIPKSPEGAFAVTGQLDLVVLPPPAEAILDELRAATDGPDDPARYLVDRVIAGLPDGQVKAIATGLAPFIAPYVEQKLDELAPHFAPGLRQLATGLGTVAHHFGTVETMDIGANGATQRTILGFAVGAATIGLRSEGEADVVASTTCKLDRNGDLAFGEHRITLAYGKLLRLGFDRAVIPSVDPDTTDLSRALADLVDCKQLGALFAERVGLGGAGIFEVACVGGMSSLALEVYDRMAEIDRTPFELDMRGTANAIDHDSDGTMDVITGGTWTGTTRYGSTTGSLGPAPFEGTKR
jgi:hypothetical protein